jgi:hypothetical protein
MPNCKEHPRCDLVCRWCGYYCHNPHHEWRWAHIRRLSPGEGDIALESDMPEDPETNYNQRAEDMP